MASRSVKQDITVEQSLAPAARTASADGSGVDLRGYESATALIDAGAWTDGTFTFELQESDDDVTYSAVADADLVGTEPVIDAATEDLVVHELGYIGSKRFVRVSVTVGGTPVTGMVFGASILRSNPKYAPVN